MLHDPRPRRRPKPSATASPEFTVQEESFLQIVDELPPLFTRFGQEKAKAPVDVDWQTLMNLATQNTLVTVTARYGGTLVGFCLTHLAGAIMYKSTLQGNTFALFLDKPYRWGMNGPKLLKYNKAVLEKRSCKRLYLTTDDPRIGKVYERVGYRYDESNYVSRAND